MTRKKKVYLQPQVDPEWQIKVERVILSTCLLYTSDAADD